MFVHVHLYEESPDSLYRCL